MTLSISLIYSRLNTPTKTIITIINCSSWRKEIESSTLVSQVTWLLFLYLLPRIDYTWLHPQSHVNVLLVSSIPLHRHPTLSYSTRRGMMMMMIKSSSRKCLVVNCSWLFLSCRQRLSWPKPFSCLPYYCMTLSRKSARDSLIMMMLFSVNLSLYITSWVDSKVTLTPKRKALSRRLLHSHSFAEQ